MSRKHRQKPITQNRAQDKRSTVQDSFQNQIARLGVGTENLMNGTSYPLTRLTQNYQLMNSLYRNSWIAKKIINCIPDDMCKNWFDITADLTPDQTDRIKKMEQRTQIKEKIKDALYWSRLYGGAAALILIEGHEHILEYPLLVEGVMPGCFKGLMVLDRWSGIYPSTEMITDVSDPEFGLPEYYEVRDSSANTVVQKVHHSRIIRFPGRKLPFWEDIVEQHWGAAELEHVFDELQKRDNTSWNIASLVFQANLLVNKVEGLDQLLSIGDSQAQQDFYRIKTAQNHLRNNQAMMIVGKDEEVQSFNYTFSGLSDVYEMFMYDISGAAEIPVTRLFGRAPGGLNSNGEGDLQIYYDMVSQRQETDLRPKIDKLLPIMFMSELGYIPKDLNFKFNPVRTTSEGEQAELVSKKTTAICDVYNAGIINQRIAMQELHEISYTTNMFTSITNEDIENAKEDFIDETEGLDLGTLGDTQTGGKSLFGEPEEDIKDDKDSDIRDDNSRGNLRGIKKLFGIKRVS